MQRYTSRIPANAKLLAVLLSRFVASSRCIACAAGQVLPRTTALAVVDAHISGHACAACHVALDGEVGLVVELTRVVLAGQVVFDAHRPRGEWAGVAG